MASQDSNLSPGRLAAATHVSVDTLRYYERKGLLARIPRSSGGHRSYPGDALRRVRVIRGALSLGFTIEELSEIFSIRDAGGRPCQRVYAIADRKIAEMDETIERLKNVRQRLAMTLKSWKRRLATTPQHQRAGLLELFAETHPESARETTPLLAAGLYRRLHTK
jgi:DNA-binding transcriptional MerR regulator